MHISLPYGQNCLEADLTWGRCLGALALAPAPPLADVPEALNRAVAHPIGLNRSLFDIVRRGETVAILVSDAFRHTGVDQLLPTLLAGLNRAGISENDILLVFATGSHRPPTPAEQKRILGTEIYERFHTRSIIHDPQDQKNLVRLGVTSRGTPVHINRRVYDCDRIIATGAVVLHYFAGFGGGRKSIVPGIAGLDTIAHNHALNLHPTEDRLDPAVRIGALDGNPVAEDMLEAARYAEVDFVINTVLNREGQIAGLFCGELEAAHRSAAEFARKVFAAPFKQRADFVIASAGGAKNFVQCHKALFNSYQTIKPGGRIIFAARSPEGFGNDQFARWMALGSRKTIIAELRQHAEINGQTALSVTEKAPSAILITDLTSEQAATLGAQKARSLEDALDRVRGDLTRAGVDEPTYYLMPSASYTVPLPTGDSDWAGQSAKGGKD